ncbi:MAG: FxLYD domain-containing protein [Planctomycetota bacterium]|jgi:hypothetical protein
MYTGYTGLGDKGGARWSFKPSVMVLCVLLFLCSLTGSLSPVEAGDAERRIMEKIIALEGTLQELMAKLDGIDKRVSALEKGQPAHRAAPKAVVPKRGAANKPRKLIDIGQGFYVIDLEYEGIVENTVFTGKLENSGGRDYQFVLIKVVAYDGKGKALGDNVLNVTGAFAGVTVPFKMTIYGVNARDIASYDFKFVKGF